MLGLGSLTLPSAFARLGWVFALVLMGLCCAGTLYSGRLFTMLTLQVRRRLLIISRPAGTGLTDTLSASAAPGERHCSGAPMGCLYPSSISHVVTELKRLTVYLVMFSRSGGYPPAQLAFAGCGKGEQKPQPHPSEQCVRQYTIYN